MQRCSDLTFEPLAGTAKTAGAYVLFEWPGGWSRDVLDGGTFGPELTKRLKGFFKGKAAFQLIRRPGREGRQIGSVHRCYLVWPDRGVMEMVLLDGPEAILDLDLSGPGRNGGGAIETPMLLVCTHAKRDQCCAIKGRPLAAQLDEAFPASMVWETSHTKGHRFAPAVLLMPWGYSFGRLNVQAATQLLELALEGHMFYPANRGSGLLKAREQVAELAVAQVLIDAGEPVGYNQLTVGAAGSADAQADDAPLQVNHPDGRCWLVDVQRVEVAGVVSSCGDEPKTAGAWQATRVQETTREQQD